MHEERNYTPIIAVIVLVAFFVGIGVWFFMGRNNIVAGVPEEGSSDRVILVTPRATPTVEVEPTAEEEPAEESEDEPTTEPTQTPEEDDETATPEPEEEATPASEE